MLSFIVPAHNEEAVIAPTLRAIRAAADSTGLAHEIIVVDDGSTDGTAGLAREAGARVIQVNVRQISRARNAGAAAATGDLLFFVDADTIVNPRVVRQAIDAIEAGAIGGGAPISYDHPVPRYATLTLPFFVWFGRTVRWASGCFMFATRSAFDAAGRFDESLYAIEEIYLSRRLKKLGRFVIVRDSVMTSGRKMRTHSYWELFWGVAKLGIGPWMKTDRAHLAIWYGPRRQDK